MEIKIVKFGGDCLSTPKNQLIVADIINKLSGKILMVCSAMGRNGFPYSTSSLELLINRNYVSLKEKDRLLAVGEIISSIRMSEVLNSLKIKSYALSYLENGIYCDNNYSKGKVIKLDSRFIYDKFQVYDILLFPGFIGQNEDKEVITLGRGNSDYSAILAAKSLHIDTVYLYKNVDGVFHTHPSVYKQFMLYDYLSYEEMILLNKIGFDIISFDAVKCAEENQINIEIYNYLTNVKGTTISQKKHGDLIIGFNIIDKNVKIATFKPLKVQQVLNEELQKKHLFIKDEIIENHIYSFESNKSIILMVKKCIINLMEKYNKFNRKKVQ